MTRSGASNKKPRKATHLYLDKDLVDKLDNLVKAVSARSERPVTRTDLVASILKDFFNR